MTIPFGHWAGLQLVRRYDTLGHVGPGSCSSAGALPTNAPQLYKDKGWTWRGEEGAALITVPGGTRLDFDITEDCYDENGDFKFGVGAVLNGRKPDGELEDGIYYVFIYGYGTPDREDGMIPASKTGVYISNYAIGYGFGSDGTRGGNGELKKPSALRYLRQHPAVLQIQNGKMVPSIAEGEGHTITCRYNLPGFRDYKSARVGGVKFNDGIKSYDHLSAYVPTEPQTGEPVLERLKNGGSSESLINRARLGVERDLKHEGLDKLYSAEDVKEIEYGLFHVTPQTHKVVEMQVEYEGEGYIYDSVSKLLGRKTAVVNGQGVTRFCSLTASDAAGRGIKLSLIGDVKITRFFMLSSTSQQPM